MSKMSRIIAFSVGALAVVRNRPGRKPAPRNPFCRCCKPRSNVADKRPILGNGSIDVGTYDPHGDFSSDSNVKFEHLFLPWEDVDLSSLAIADEYALQRGRTLMITIEPWSWSVDWRLTPDQLLKGVLARQVRREHGCHLHGSGRPQAPRDHPLGAGNG